MLDAPTLKLPSWPARVLFFHRCRQGPAKDDDDTTSGGGISSTEDVDPESKKSPDMFGSEPSYQRLQAPAAPVSRFRQRLRQRRIRWALGGALVVTIIAIILLSTLLTRHVTDGLDTVFKVRFTYLIDGSIDR